MSPRITRGAHRGRLPNPQQREHNNSETKGMGIFFTLFPLAPLFYSGRAAPAFLPACRAESCLYRAFPTATATTTHVPIRLTGPVTPLNAKTPRQTGPQDGPARHAGNTYPNARLATIHHYCVGPGGGCFLEITLATMTQRPQQRPQPHSFP